MNIIDKYDLLNRLEENVPEEGTEEYKKWEYAYNLIYSQSPLANPVLDSISFRTELLKNGFNFNDLKTIMGLVHKCSCNKDYSRPNITLELPLSEQR